MPYASWTKAVEAGANADQLAAYAVDRLGRFADGEHVLIDFLDRAAVGQFCRALGFSSRRNWAALTLDVIAPPDGPAPMSSLPKRRPQCWRCSGP